MLILYTEFLLSHACGRTVPLASVFSQLGGLNNLLLVFLCYFCTVFTECVHRKSFQ